MNGKMAGSIAVLATLMITPVVAAKDTTCLVTSIENNQVTLQCESTQGLQPQTQVKLKPVGKKALEGC